MGLLQILHSVIFEVKLLQLKTNILTLVRAICLLKGVPKYVYFLCVVYTVHALLKIQRYMRYTTGSQNVQNSKLTTKEHVDCVGKND